MRTIYKYPFAFDGSVELVLPIGAEILHIGVQDGVYCLWALVDTEVKNEIKRIRIIGTGHEVSEDIGIINHITTIQDGQYVWHIFDVP